MSRLYYLDEQDIHGIVSWLTKDLFPDTPAFHLAGSEGAGRLASALAQPRVPYHRTAQRKAAALHYSLNKNHPFVDGNKRLAVAAMELFLLRNRFFLLATNRQLLDFSLRVADGRLTRDASAEWIQRRVLRTTWTERHRGRSIAKWIGSVPHEEIAEVIAASHEAGGGTDFTRAIRNAIEQGIIE